MENKKKLGTGVIIALVAIVALNILWLASELIIGKGSLSLTVLVCLLMYIASVVYVLYAYKKPHGNFMRYLLLAYDALGSVFFITLCKNQEVYLIVTNVVMIYLMSYMAGRLDHFKQNIVICGIILAGTLVVSVDLLIKMSNLGMLNFFMAFRCIGSTTCWLAIAAGYILRYKEHKEAGLTDKN